MFERVLIAYDEARPDGSLIFAAMSVTDPRRASLTVLSVRADGSGGSGLTLAAERLGRAGYRARIRVRLGTGPRVAEEVVRAMADCRPDLVVLGSRGLESFENLVEGSVTQEVLAHAGCPVLIARGKADPSAPGLLLLAYDDSGHSQRAAGIAGKLARALGAEIRVISITQPLVAAGHSASDSSASRQLDELVAGLGSEVVTSGSVKESSAGKARAIVETAELAGADMIVMGSRGLSRIAGAVIGSVSHEVIQLWRGQVLLVP